MSKTSTSNFGNQPEYSGLTRNSLAGTSSSGLSVVSLNTNAATTATLTASQIAGGVLLHTGTHAIDVTTPSASDIAALCGNRVGNSVNYYHKKSGTGKATILAGSGVTLVDSPEVDVGESVSVLMLVTGMNPAAVSVYTL